MPADTSTPILGLLLQGTGNNNNTWGTNLNNSVITPLENACAGSVNLAQTGGAYTLTQANAAYSLIVLTGTLSSDLTITVPAVAHSLQFLNAMVSGGFVALIKVAGQTAVNIPFGRTTRIYCDSVNMFREDRDRVGEYFFHAGSAVPESGIECTGAAISRANFPDLFAKLGTLHGVGNGTTTFNVPNGTTSGMFLRSRTGSVTVGTTQSSQNLAHTHTGSGTTGTVSNDHTHTGSGTTSGRSAQHNHSYTAGDSNGITYAGGVSAFHGTNSSASTTGAETQEHTHTYSFTSSGISANHTHTYSFTTSGGSADGGEARPSNITGILCVRY